MTTSKMLALFAAALCVGAYRGLSAQYREWKANRSLLPEYERNAGFITDRKLLWFERSLIWPWWTFVAVTVGGALWVVGLATGWWCWSYCPSN